MQVVFLKNNKSPALLLFEFIFQED